MDLISYLYEQAIAREAFNAQSKASEVEAQCASLRREHQQLKLLIRALWSLLKEPQGLTDADLKRHVLAAQAAVEKASGHYWTCTCCRHQVPAAVKRCPYCGLVVEDDAAF